jgi:cytochrome c peroxidase
MACVDCHHPKKAYTNFIGQYGELRDPLPNFNRILGKVHFWDGRVDSLEQQVRVPIESPLEMRTTPEEVLRKIRASSGYRRQFETIFGEITFDAFSRAIASFERVLVTEPSAWDRSQAGESDALTAAAQRGAELFASERTRCNTCHSGPNFTDESFHHVGTGGGRKPDAGRYNVTNLPQDRGAFRTPTLRNVAQTGPYFHDARFQSLAEVVRWFNAGGHEDSEDNSANNELKPLNLTASEQADLIVFLEGLSSDLPPVATGRLPE